MSTSQPDLSDFQQDSSDMSDFTPDAQQSRPTEAQAIDNLNSMAAAGEASGARQEQEHYVADRYAQAFPMVLGGGIAKAGEAAGPVAGAIGKFVDRIKQAAGVASTAVPPQVETAQHIPVGQLPIAKGNPYTGPRTPASMEIAQSSNIGLHGYHPESQTMLVQFKNGRVYEYKGVPQEIYDAYRNDPASQGSFFAQNIKGRYETSFRGTVKPSAGEQVRKALSGKR